MNGRPLACGCSGVVEPADCLEIFSGISQDPQHCATDRTFTCGRDSCAAFFEVCVQSALEAADGECVRADDIGCSQYGIGSCNCVTLRDDQQCVVPGDIEAVRVIDRTEGG